MKRKLALLMIACAMAIPTSVGYAEWVVYQEITGVGNISQTYPSDTVPNRRNLHYAGTGSPETASFEIDVSGVHDYDCDDDDGEVEDAGLEETSTDWWCTASTGTVTDNAYSTTFTPSSGIYSGIQIKCTVHEGHSYSYSDGNYDDPVTKTWSSTLKTFKVGVKMDPGNVHFWEDDADSEELMWLHATIGGLQAWVWTTTLGTPGQVTETGDLAKKDLTWEALAETDTGTVGGIMGTIDYSPRIRCNGKVRLTFGRGGTTFGSLGTLASTLVGIKNPYVGALCQCIVSSVGTKTHYKCQVLGSAVIENAGDPKIGSASQYVGSELFPSPVNYNLNSLNVTGSETADVGDVVDGSLDFESLCEVYDNSALSYGEAHIWIIEEGTNYFGSSRPTYSP